MNGFTLMANAKRKLMNEGHLDRETAEREIYILEFLATCNKDDLCFMVDSSAFNDIIRAFVKFSAKYAGIGKENQDKVVNALHGVFNDIPAKEALNRFFEI